MAIAQRVAGYSLGQADLLRRAMGKKKQEILDKEFAGFEAGMRERGFSAEATRTLWDILLPFSGYAFNKSHTAGYGIVAFWTAYLKANHPAAYMAALLTSVGDDKDKSAVYLAECRRMGIKVLPPDVNASRGRFTAVGGDVRFGLGAVRNVGGGVVDAIVRARREHGEFSGFYDFLRKVDAVVCNKRTVESLIKAGAFDSLGHSRKGLLTVHADAIDSYLDVKRNEAVGQFDLFGGAFEEMGAPVAAPPIPDGEWDKAEKPLFEREMLGLYVSDHPLAGLERMLRANSDHALAQVLGDDGMPDGTPVAVAGMLSGVSQRVTKQGKVWASATLEDLAGAVEVLFFPNTYELVRDAVHDDQVVAVKGRVNRRDAGSLSIAVQDMRLLDVNASEVDGRPVTIQLRDSQITKALLDRIGEALDAHRGSSEVRIHLRYSAPGRGADLLRLPHTVEPTAALLADLKALVGAGSIT